MLTKLEELWPPFGLEITLGPVSLSPVRDDDLPELAALVLDGIHAAADMPFTFPWTEGSVDVVRLRLRQHQWAQRAAMSPDASHLMFHSKPGTRLPSSRHEVVLR